MMRLYYYTKVCCIVGVLIDSLQQYFGFTFYFEFELVLSRVILESQVRFILHGLTLCKSHRSLFISLIFL